MISKRDWNNKNRTIIFSGGNPFQPIFKFTVDKENWEKLYNLDEKERKEKIRKLFKDKYLIKQKENKNE